MFENRCFPPLWRALVLAIATSSALFSRWDQTFEQLSAQAAKAREAEDTRQAMRLYREALRLQPQWSEGWWYLGTLAYDQSDFADASTALGELVQLSPGNANAFAMLGLSEVKLKQNRLALTHLSRSLSLGLGDERNLRLVVLFNQANVLLENGAFGKAQAILDQLSRLKSPPEEEVVLSLGRAVLGINSAASASSSESRDMILAAGRAEGMAANRETSNASTAYADLVKRYPRVHDVQFAYGRFLLQNHLDEEAVVAFKREIENSPQHLLARLGIAGVLLHTDAATSLAYSRQALQLARGLAEAHYLAGAALLALNRFPESLAELNAARTRNADDPRIYFALAKVYARLDRPAEAASARTRFAQLSSAQ